MLEGIRVLSQLRLPGRRNKLRLSSLVFEMTFPPGVSTSSSRGAESMVAKSSFQKKKSELFLADDNIILDFKIKFKNLDTASIIHYKIVWPMCKQSNVTVNHRDTNRQ